MKRFLRLFAVVSLALITLLSGCSRGVKTTGVSDIAKAGALTVLVPFDGSPYAYQETDGKWAGVEIELMDNIGKALEVPVTYVGAEKGAGLPEQMETFSANLAIGRITMSNYGNSSDFSTSRAYNTARIYAVTPRGVYFPTLSIFAGKKVGLSPAVSDRGEFLAGSGGATAVYYKNHEGVADALINADLTAYFCYRDEANLLTSVNYDLQSQDLYGVDAEQFVVVSRPAQADLLNTANAVINQMIEDGSLKAALDKYVP